jgi:hypothetical protein
MEKGYVIIIPAQQTEPEQIRSKYYIVEVNVAGKDLPHEPFEVKVHKECEYQC